MRENVLIPDKSAFQALSLDEAICLEQRYILGLPPTFVYEVLASLTKRHRRASAAAFTQSLASKLGGTGPPISLPYRDLILAELVRGDRIPMTGQFIPDGAAVTRDGQAMLVNPTALNEAILRWSYGEFSAEDCDLALAWRASAQGLSELAFHAQVRHAGATVPAPASDLSNLGEIIDDVLGSPRRHGGWLKFILDELRIEDHQQQLVLRRWRDGKRTDLRTFAPYTWHCLRSLVAVMTLHTHKRVKRSPSHLIDAQYLFYIPFCTVFASRDRLHERTAGPLLRDDQSFLWGDDLKRELQDALRVREEADADC